MPFHYQDYLTSLGNDQFAHLLATHHLLGFHPETNDIFLMPALNRYAGTYVCGVQGVGKSGFLENLIGQDIALGHSVIVIDPHGDLIDHCIAQLPEDKLSKVHVLDMTDEAYPFGVNLFGGPTAATSTVQTQAVDRVIHVFEVIWPDVMSQQHFPRFLRAATIVLFANPGSTLVDMHTFLTDEDVRQQMLKAVSDPTVLQFWQAYDELSPSARRQEVAPLVGRLESLFMGRSFIRGIVGQRETSIDFRKAIENKEIIFIKLPIKTLAQDARLIGTLLIAQIHAAIFSFADMPEDQRPGFSLYVDEVQHFVTSDFAEMFTEGRKFGVRVTMAHQYRGQLPGFLRESTMTARTKVCFQSVPEDGREMAHLFLHGEPTIQPEDIDPHPVEHLLHYGSDNRKVQTFVEIYLQPLQRHKKSGNIEIAKAGFRLDHLWFHLLGVKPPDDKLAVPDPTPQLNHLLYEAMKTGEADLPIPLGVAYGFANCGRGFFSTLRYSLSKRALLSAEVRFPPYLVVEKANGGSRWTRVPEGGKEQMQHFLFHLRETMKYLADNPIGKKSALSVSEVASMLTALPKRAAFIRSGEEVGVIYTEDTAPMVDSATLRERLCIIQDQTRQKYCRPIHQPSDDTLPGKPDEEPPSSRWEEVE